MNLCRWHPLPLHNLYCKCMARCLTLKMKIKVMEHNIRNYAFWWKKSKSKKILKIHFFWLVFTISQILATLTLTNIDLENVGQGHGVKCAQSCHCKTNINVCKSHNPHFYFSSHCFILMFQMFELENLGQGHRVQHSQRWCSVANTNLYTSQQAFYASSHRFRDNKFEIYYLEN